MVVHPVAVDVPAGSTEIVITDLHPGNLGVDVKEIAVAVFIEGVELLIFRGVGSPCVDIGAVGVEDDICFAHDILDGILPFVRVGSQLVLVNPAVGGVAVGVTGDEPAIFLQTFGNGLGLLHFGVPVFHGHNAAVFHIIAGLGTVAEDTFVAGHTQHGPGTVVGKVGMLLNKGFQRRHQIVGAGGDVAVGIHVFAGGVAVLTDDDLVSEAVTAYVGIDGRLVFAVTGAHHIAVVVHVVLAHEEGDLSLRQADVAVLKPGAVIVHHFVGDVVGGDQHETPVIHALQDLVEFIHRDHVHVVAVLIDIAVKGPLRIHNERVEEDVGDVVQIIVADQRFVQCVVGIDLCFDLTAFFVACHAFQQSDGTFVIIAGGKLFRLCQSQRHFLRVKSLGGGDRGGNRRLLQLFQLFVMVVQHGRNTDDGKSHHADTADHQRHQH